MISMTDAAAIGQEQPGAMGSFPAPPLAEPGCTLRVGDAACSPELESVLRQRLQRRPL